MGQSGAPNQGPGGMPPGQGAPLPYGDRYDQGTPGGQEDRNNQPGGRPPMMPGAPGEQANQFGQPGMMNEMGGVGQ